MTFDCGCEISTVFNEQHVHSLLLHLQLELTSLVRSPALVSNCCKMWNVGFIQPKIFDTDTYDQEEEAEPTVRVNSSHGKLHSSSFL